MNPVITIVTGIIGTLGFGLLMNLKKTRLLYVALGSGITCGVYVISCFCFESVFIQNLFPTLAAAIYCEIIARIVKAPVIVFLISSLIPLVPGGSLYYTMHYLLEGNGTMAAGYGQQTLQCALGIAAGIVLVSVLASYLFDFYQQMVQKEKRI